MMQPGMANLESGCTHRTPIPSLPLELEAYIIDCLQDDKFALLACALVCHSWIARAQSHIFHEVRLSDSRADGFAQVLETSPHIARYVKVCRVKAMGPRYKNLMSVFPMLDNVQQLHISAFRPGMPAIELLAASCSSITSLSLRSCLFVTANEIFTFLAALRRLDSLEIHDSGLLVSPRAPQHMLKTSGPELRLSYLKFSSCSDILPWIIVDYAVVHVDTVWISFWGSDSHIAKVINKLGHCISHLEIHPITSGSIMTPPYVVQHFSIAPCTSLRTLTFEEPILYLSSLYVITLLSQITSSVVEKISFRIGYSDPKSFNMFPLEQAEEILTRPLFRALQTVVFNLYGRAAHSGADDIPPIRIRMKLLDRRGMLQFVMRSRNPTKRYLHDDYTPG